MKNITPFKNISFYSMILGLLVVSFSSCSSSQQAYNADDGIYGNGNAKQEVVMVRDTRTDYYQNYFSGEHQNNEEYFTDIDAYEGNYDTDTVYVEDQYVGNPPWERTASSVSINFNVGIGAGYGATAMDGVTQDGVTQDGVITRLITQVIILHIIQAITKDPLTENDMLIILAE